MPESKHKCPVCGQPKQVGRLICNGCWEKVPTALKRAWHSETNRRGRITTGNAIVRWFQRRETKHSPFLSTSDDGVLHFDAPAFMRTERIAPTEANVERVARAALAELQAAYPGVRSAIVTEDDYDPDT